MSTRLWTMAEAKAKLGKIIDLAQSDGPQTITRNGRPVAVAIAYEERKRKTKRTGSLLEFFAASPLRESGLAIERIKDQPRKVDL